MTTTSKKQLGHNDYIPVVIIVGPTASGKTSLSIALAQQCNAEIISADSRQVFVGLDIGTGKVTEAEKEGVPHHLIDVQNPTEVFSAHDFVTRAATAIAEITARGKLPIIAGGTGFYIDALTGRVALGVTPANEVLRAELADESPEALFEKLSRLNPTRAATIKDKKEERNKVRLIRAIELATPTEEPTESFPLPHLNPLWIGLTFPRETLRARIDTRLRERIAQGMFDEMRTLYKNGLSLERMHALGLEYRYGAMVISGTLTEAEAEELLQQKIWQYARRQLTYWKRNHNIRWFTPEVGYEHTVATIVKGFLEKPQTT